MTETLAPASSETGQILTFLRCIRCGGDNELADSFVCEPCLDLQLAPAQILNRAAAKSSTNVLNASVCQSCGCKLDGKALRRACDCKCHKEGPV